MTEPLRVLESLREVEVPVGARSRVRARIEAQLDRGAITRSASRRRWVVGAMLAAPVAVIAVFVLWPRSEVRTISVALGDRKDVALAAGHVSIRGPAEAVVARGELSLTEGTVDAQGQLRVKGPSCDVMVEGSAEVSVNGAQLTVRVFAGSVQIMPPVATCEMIELQSRPITASAPHQAKTPTKAEVIAARDVAVAGTPEVVVGVATPPRAPKPRVPSSRQPAPAVRVVPSTTLAVTPNETLAVAPTESTAVVPIESTAVVPSPIESPGRSQHAAGSDALAEAVAAYHAAVALEASDLQAARGAWTAWRVRWSASALSQSADLHLLSVLERLDRHDEAAELAREFVRRYPRSPRRADVERMLEDSERGR